MLKTSSRCRFTLTLLVLAIAASSTVARAQFSVLYTFGTNAGDPLNPTDSGIIAQGRDGNLYSTAPLGGTLNVGAMFKVTPIGTLTVPYSFDSTDQTPNSGLTLGTDGSFYGTTEGGGTSGMGTVFKITPSGTVTVLHSFAGSDGSQPNAPPIQGTDSNFYGTTQAGGTNDTGTVYKITPAGKFTTLYSFDANNIYSPIAPLVQGTDGNFYGTTPEGGSSNDGMVYKITPSGKLTTLHSFSLTDGQHPVAPLVQGTDGNFYGTTFYGGTGRSGVIFKITATGNFKVLHNINGSTDGAVCVAGLVQATDGNFYGTTGTGGASSRGTIFRISPGGSYSVLYNFDGTTTGGDSFVTLLQHTNGILYGDTNNGGVGTACGSNGCGVFYSLNVGLKPFVSLVSTSGKVGKTVGILGQGFKGTTDVSFNGTAATFKVVSSTYLTATVPNGATTGFVTVKTPGGTLTSNKKFRVTRL